MKRATTIGNLLLLSLPFTLWAQDQQRQPNIIFILADDMGYGDVSCMDRQSRLQTPSIDRLGHDGVIFTDAHSSSSVSTPTRYGLLTGRYNWRSDIKQGVLDGYSKALIPAGRETIASMLQQQGYTTACIGKWHLGWDWNNIDAGREQVDFTQPITNGPTTRGFDYFYGFCGSLDMAPYVYVENDQPTAPPNRTTVNNGKYSWWRKGPTGADFVHEEVLPNFIRRACEYVTSKAPSPQPYFLYLPLAAPHTPILPTKEFQGKSGIGEYGDFVLMVDAMVGRVLQAVRASGEEENTLIVFTTDNGCAPAAGIQEMTALGHHPNSIYRGHKADLFDGGHRIPCLLRWPAQVKPHQVQQTICLTDFYATFAAISGHTLKDTEGEDSYNLLPAIQSVEETAPIREATVHHSFTGQFTIRQGEWKLLLSPSSGGWSTPVPTDTALLAQLPAVQLYNMKTDPSETHNAEASHPDKVKELRELLIRYIRNGRSTPGKPQPNDGIYPWKQLKDFMSPEDFSTPSPSSDLRSYVIPIQPAISQMPTPTDTFSHEVRYLLRRNTQYILNRWYADLKQFSQQEGAYLDLGGRTEHFIRPVAHNAFTLAVCLKLGVYDASTTQVPTPMARDILVRLIRSTAWHHKANEGDKGWGDQWQSALWASQVAHAAWMGWEWLSPSEQELVCRMTIHEADRFITYQVPYYRDASGKILSKGDTKAEENAWNSNILAIATAMMPHHPHYHLWMNKSIELQLSAFARPEDLNKTTLIDGIPVHRLLKGSNLNSDGTVVNHHIIHPDYMSAFMQNGINAWVNALAGKPSLQSSVYNGEVVYRALVELDFQGRTIYQRNADGQPTSQLHFPQGNDWGGKRQANYWLMDVMAHVFGWDKDMDIQGKEWATVRNQEMMRMINRDTTGQYYQDRQEDTYPSREEWFGSHIAWGYLGYCLHQNGLVTVPTTDH